MPSAECGSFIAPSLFLSLSYCVKGDELLMLEKSAKACQTTELKLNKDILEAIPGFSRCPSCLQKVILDLENRNNCVLNCSCGEKYLATPGPNIALLPLTLFSNLGTCQGCNEIIENPQNLKEIDCPRCRKKTLWKNLSK